MGRPRSITTLDSSDFSVHLSSMSNSAMKRAPVLIRADILLLSVVWLFSCSTRSIVTSVIEEADFNGAWVDTTVVIAERGGNPIFNIPPALDTSFWVSALELNSGSFTLTVPDAYSSFAVPNQWGASNFLIDKVYHGLYVIAGDSIFFDYHFDSSKYDHIEPFRLQLFRDSLILYYNNDAGVDTTTARDNPDSVVYFGLVRPPSILWPYMSQKMRGVFRRVEQ